MYNSNLPGVVIYNGLTIVWYIYVKFTNGIIDLFMNPSDNVIAVP